MRLKITASQVIILVFLSACVWLEPTAPARSFEVSDLLIDETVLPSDYSSYEPFSTQEYSCFECSSVQFPKTTSNTVATLDVLRYLSAGAARRLFPEIKSTAPFQYSEVPWSYQSPIASEVYFGCFEWTPPEVGPVCQWGGRYEEYIVVFRTVLGPEGMTVAEMEGVIQAIDKNVEAYLGPERP
jgi:hypothetical protein